MNVQQGDKIGAWRAGYPSWMTYSPPRRPRRNYSSCGALTFGAVKTNVGIIQGMRINLTTPFAEKDKAKALGARWDVARKTWYIEDVEDLTPFRQWIPDLAGWDEKKATQGPKKPRKPAKQAKAKASTPKTTGEAIPEHCGCNVLPWEHCEHSNQQGLTDR